jgi:hypothetical protein
MNGLWNVDKDRIATTIAAGLGCLNGWLAIAHSFLSSIGMFILINALLS